MTTTIVYATKSEFKQAELALFVEQGQHGGKPVADLVDFDVREIDVKEVLEVDLEEMVRHEVRAAYAALKVPCIVEHAGLIFVHREPDKYPGGLTKPMWNALSDRFIEETHSAGVQAIARAVIGYCDGQSVQTFIGDSSGRIAAAPRGQRKFYWDTIFEPDSSDPRIVGKTYAEIVDDAELGLKTKVLDLSQSFKAMSSLLDYRLSTKPELWDSRYAG